MVLNVETEYGITTAADAQTFTIEDVIKALNLGTELNKDARYTYKESTNSIVIWSDGMIHRLWHIPVSCLNVYGMATLLEIISEFNHGDFSHAEKFDEDEDEEEVSTEDLYI